MPISPVSCSRSFPHFLKSQTIFFLEINPLTSNIQLSPQHLSIWALKSNLRFNSQVCRRFSSLHSLFKHCKKMPPKTVASAPRIEAEYAKSARATCKKCGNNIVKGSLRLGIISKAAGGFDMTRWHHLHCFKADITAAENINGFSLLKASDQEALRNLVAEFGKEPEKSITAVAKLHGNEGSCQKGDMHEDDQGSSKKPKLSGQNDEDFLNLFSPSKLNSRYKDAILPLKWKAFQTVILLGEDDGLRASEKIAAFDFDGCLVKTSLKRVGADAWSLQYQSVPEKLQSYHNKGYKLVIFTNESNIDRWKNSRQKAVDSKVGRLEGFIKRVEVPIQIFIACGIEGTGDPFRKPKPGMWSLMERHFNAGIAVDMEQSFYVGDAAGRIDDHSDADIGFAKEMATNMNNHEFIEVLSGETTNNVSSPSIPIVEAIILQESCCSVNQPTNLSANVQSVSSVLSTNCHDIVQKFKVECQFPLVEEEDIITLQDSCIELEGLCTFMKEMYYDGHYTGGATSSIVQAYEMYLNTK